MAISALFFIFQVQWPIELQHIKSHQPLSLPSKQIKQTPLSFFTYLLVYTREYVGKLNKLLPGWHYGWHSVINPTQFGVD